MTNRLSRDTEYVLVRDAKSRKPLRQYYDTDDENDSQPRLTTRKVVQKKPVKGQRIKYVATEEHEPDYRRVRLAGSNDVCNLQIKTNFIDWIICFF